ncbi:phospho-sugar mutase [Oceanobacillus piezotolerans]|uniref:Phosphoglucomutase n=1 Tax=Oceanobacillus piezotolerans TaxID=2448030 RepID=A0A498D8G8_9BACI|nr:phospho-sugar mutase [Oceanobacillus piezotolerans]RLL42833.1 phospho-sugar mutase [Oceanobacillus piezotolerans]
MRSWEQVYQKWSLNSELDEKLKFELDQEKSEQALEDAFYKELSFGTGGMRGILGAGTNRMNIYTVRKAVDGLANYLLVHRVNVRDRGVVIAYDSRHMSREFALEAAKVLGVYGIKAHIFQSIHPTPLLSFAVRYLNTAAGMMITASHNPPNYNGLKVYNENGGQIIPQEADQIVQYIDQVKDELSISIKEQSDLEKEGLLYWIGNEIDHAYLERLKYISQMRSSFASKKKDLSIVFTPLHGTSYDLVTKGLEQLNFTNVHVVEQQAVPDPEFSTVESPNPEEHQAFEMAMDLGKQKDADILLATDPDGDRLGVAVKNKAGDYQVLTGNQLGVLLLEYILKHSNLSIVKNARIVKSVVTTELAEAIADSYGVELINTLTGFKYIGEKIQQFDSTGETFIFGFEESYGYLISGFVRDKDAVQAAVTATEMAFYWKGQGKTLLDALDDIYKVHGYYLEGMSSLTLNGKEGARQISETMEGIRLQENAAIGRFRVVAIEDYLVEERTVLGDNQTDRLELPKENMLKFILEGNAWVCLRPSGTEPKLKYYYGVCGQDKQDAEVKLEELKQEMDSLIKSTMTVMA